MPNVTRATTWSCGQEALFRAYRNATSAPIKGKNVLPRLRGKIPGRPVRQSGSRLPARTAQWTRSAFEPAGSGFVEGRSTEEPNFRPLTWNDGRSDCPFRSAPIRRADRDPNCSARSGVRPTVFETVTFGFVVAPPGGRFGVVDGFVRSPQAKVFFGRFPTCLV